MAQPSIGALDRMAVGGRLVTEVVVDRGFAGRRVQHLGQVGGCPLTLMEFGPAAFEEIDPATGGVGNTGPPAAA